jgi:hypothetical protein
MINAITITTENPPTKELVGIDFNSEIINLALKNVNIKSKAVKIYILKVLFIIKILNHVQFLPFQ